MSRTASITFVRAALVIAASLRAGRGRTRARDTPAAPSGHQPRAGRIRVRRRSVDRAARAADQARRLTSTPAAEIDPWFSPDGSRIAFTATVGGNTDVYVVATTGGEPTRLTFHPSLDAARGWSPDGRQVLFASTRETVPVPGLPSIFRLWSVAVAPTSAVTAVPDVLPMPERSPAVSRPTDAAWPTRTSGSGSPLTGRRTRAACGGTIAADARGRSG